jgi:hypothetical protein
MSHDIHPGRAGRQDIRRRSTSSITSWRFRRQLQEGLQQPQAVCHDAFLGIG